MTWLRDKSGERPILIIIKRTEDWLDQSGSSRRRETVCTEQCW